MSIRAGSFSIEPLDAQSASKIPRLFYEHYGYSYSIDWLYSGERILEAANAGRIDPIVVMRDGVVSGYMDFRFSFRSRAVVEVGVIIVDPQLDEVGRGRVASILLNEGIERVTNHVHRGKLRLVISTETTDHAVTQRWIYRIGMVPTGLLFATVPADAHVVKPFRFGPGPRDHASPSRRRQGHRRAEVLSVHPIQYQLTPYAVHLPEQLAEMLKRIYAKFDLPMQFQTAGPPEGNTEIEVVHNVVRGIAIIDVTRLGADAPARVMDELQHFVVGHVPSVQIFLPISQCDPTAAVEALLAAGCFFGGLIPRFKDSDRLVLQYADQLDPLLSDAHLTEDIPREILAMTRSSTQG